MFKANPNDIWSITNERHDASPLLGFLPLFSSMTTDIKALLNGGLDLEFLVEFSNRHVRMAAIPLQWEKAGLLTVEKLSSPNFVDQIVRGLENETINLNRVGDFLFSADFSAFADQDLAKEISSMIGVLRDFIVFNNIINTSDFYHEAFTRKIMECLQNSLGVASRITAEAAYSVLTTPEKTVWIQEEETSLIELLAMVCPNPHLVSLARQEKLDEFFHGVSNAFGSELETHVKKYFWIRYEQEGEILSGRHFCNELAKMLLNGVDPANALNSIHARRTRTKEQFDSMSATIVLDSEIRHLLEVARKFVYWKLHLREVKVRFYCCADKLLDEVAKRLNLNRHQVRHLTVEELTGALYKMTRLDIVSLSKRMKYCVFHFASGQITVYEGQAAREVFGVVKQETVVVTDTVNGVCAFPGLVEGVVKQVLDVNDGDNFVRGSILVAYMTDVGVVPAMKKASAIVTDVGGVTCHASIIAREFGIPCLIGTKVGTKVLLSGYTARVNATAGFAEVLSKTVRPQENSTADEAEAKEEDLIVCNFQIPVVGCSCKKPDYVCSLEKLFSSDVPIVGGKGAALGQMLQLGLPVPIGFVVTTSAFEEVFFGTEYGTRINQLLLQIRDQRSLRQVSKMIQELIVNAEIPFHIKHSIKDSFTALPFDCVAVRSSATSEDSATASWAGQLDSFLNTTHDDLLLNIRKCWASLFSDRAISYRIQCGSKDVSVAVVVQGMVDSRISGTAFSVHPVTGQNNAVFIESCIGLGETLVLGKEMPTTFLVKKDGLAILCKDIGEQKNGLRRSAGKKGNELFAVDSTMQPLSDAEAQYVTRLVFEVEQKFGFPVDVEWAFEGNQLYLLQSRPITTMSKVSRV